MISKRLVCLHEKIHKHDWVYFDYKVTKNMEICDLISCTQDLIPQCMFIFSKNGF